MQCSQYPCNGYCEYPHNTSCNADIFPQNYEFASCNSDFFLIILHYISQFWLFFSEFCSCISQLWLFSSEFWVCISQFCFFLIESQVYILQFCPFLWILSLHLAIQNFSSKFSRYISQFRIYISWFCKTEVFFLWVWAPYSHYIILNELKTLLFHMSGFTGLRACPC